MNKPFPSVGLCLGIVAVAIILVNIGIASRGHPTIVVNMPKDARPLATLSNPGDKVIGSDRAVFWYTVFKASVDASSGTQRAVWNADAAVDKVYGPTPNR